MNYKIAFLDRDGTINKDKNYIYKIDDFEFLPGVISGLKKLQQNGFLLVIVTNQSGVARGYYKEEDIEVLHRHYSLHGRKFINVAFSDDFSG